MPSAAITAKAQRLVAEGRVERVSDREFRVRGDGGTYRVVIGEHARWCTCRRVHGIAADAKCSHIAAALLALEAVA